MENIPRPSSWKLPAKAAAVGAAALLVSLCVAVFQPQSVAGTAAAGSPAGPGTASGEPVGPPQNVIVVLKDDAPDPDVVAGDHVAQHGPGVHVKQTYHAALKGYSATVSAEALDAIKQDPRVKFVSEDREVHITDIPTGVDRIDAEIASGGTAFAPTPSFAVAVIDTGIELAHPDLNAVDGINCISPGTPAQDDNGHGTHVAGIIGARNDVIAGVGVVGVAPGTKLIAVKVLDTYGSGLWSQVICGIDFVTANAAALNIKVANMSLAGYGSDDGNCGNTNGDAFHQAICRSVAAGVTYVVAAGNHMDDVALWAPAAYNEVITATALADYDGQRGGLGTPTNTSWCPNYGPDDTFASFSNYATGLDQPHTIAAPGVCITSTTLLSMGGAAALSGTSMASPHVAGAAALYIESHPGASPAQVLSGLKASGEALGAGHSDPSGLHPEPVVNAQAAYSAPAISSPTATATPAATPSSSGDTVPPAVVISQPSDGATVTAGKTVVIAAAASDNVGVRKVEFWVNGARKCSDTAAPYRCSWGVPSSAGITYSLVAKAYDAAGNMGSHSISVVSGHDITPPTVGIASPASAASLAVGATVTLSALASDDVGVTKVEFWVNGSRKCSDSAAPYTCSWRVPSTPGITYTIEARAFDATGNIARQSIAVISQ